jgi:hypothetical protein
MRNQDRVANRQVLIEAAVCRDGKARPTAEWVSRLESAGVPCGPINGIDAVFDDPQVRARAMQISMPHASAGSVPLVASPLRLSKTPASYRLAPPLLGSTHARGAHRSARHAERSNRRLGGARSFEAPRTASRRPRRSADPGQRHRSRPRAPPDRPGRREAGAADRERRRCAASAGRRRPARLAFLAAGADAAVELQVVADHADARQHVGAVADQRRALDRRADLAVLDQVGLARGEHEFARGDVDLAAAEIDRVQALLRPRR